MSLRRPMLAILGCLAALRLTASETVVPANLADNAALPEVMVGLAQSMLTNQKDSDVDFTSLFRIQLVAKRYTEALETLEKMRAPLASNPSPRVRARYFEYLLYARSVVQSTKANVSFQQAFRLRDECLNEHWFTSLSHARVVIEAWRLEYNDERPKKILGGLTPAQYAKQLANKAATMPENSKALCY